MDGDEGSPDVFGMMDEEKSFEGRLNLIEGDGMVIDGAGGECDEIGIIHDDCLLDFLHEKMCPTSWVGHIVRGANVLLVDSVAHDIISEQRHGKGEFSARRDVYHAFFDEFGAMSLLSTYQYLTASSLVTKK